MALYETEQDSLDTRVALPLLTYVRLFSMGQWGRCALILVLYALDTQTKISRKGYCAIVYYKAVIKTRFSVFA